MDDSLLAALVAALLAGLGGLLVPRLVAAVPEPPVKDEPATDEPATDEARAEETEQAPEPQPAPEPPKAPYVEIAARPGLGVRSAIVAAVSGGLIGAATGLDWPLLWLVPLVPVAVALSVIDWHTRLLPRIVVVPATLAAILLVVVVGLATGEQDAVVRALVAMVLARSFYWLLWAVRSAGMGFGDVRLAAPVGLVLGWQGWGELAIGIWAAFLIFTVPAIGVILVRRDRTLLKRSFPFGPFMLVGALVGLVWGTLLAGRLWG